MLLKEHKRVFIAGAGGTLGLPLLQRLTKAGHHVTGLTRSAGKRALIESKGADAVVADALDREAVEASVYASRPTHLVNLLTALPPNGARRPRELRPTNRLRIEGSRNLLAAALRSGVQRVVTESFLAAYGFPAPGGKLNEETPLGPIDAHHSLYETVMALRSLERQHQNAHGQAGLECVILRFGVLYGPGVSSTETMLQALRRGRMWIPAPITGTLSWIHLEDAVAALAAALEGHAPTGIYNISDDQPLGLGQAVEIARMTVNAPPPRFFPAWLLHLFAPLVTSMSAAHWALDNRKARRELAWRLQFRTLEEGFASHAMATANPAAGVRRR